MLKLVALRRRRGAAVVEFAIIATLLVPLLMWSMYFADLAKMRLKSEEIARYTAWEFTAFPLSDYENTNHADFYTAAEQNIRQDVVARYGDDLRSDSCDDTDACPIGRRDNNKFLTGEFTFEAADVTIENQTANFLPGPEGGMGSTGNEMIDAVLSKLNQGINAIIGLLKFNTRGQIKVEVTLHYKNTFVPHEFAQEFFENPMFPEEVDELELTDSLTLVADGWALLDGEDVYPWGGYEKGGRDALLYKQVDRITAWGILAHNIPGLDILADALGWIQQIPILGDIVDVNPLQTRVASVASRGDETCPANKMEINVDCGEGHDSDGMHTTPIREYLFEACKNPRSEYGRTFLARGSHYMGCPEAQLEKKDCWPP
jgi:hypothetical protein